MPFVVPVSSLVATIIDAWGEVVAEVSAPDEAHIAANTPQGCAGAGGSRTPEHLLGRRRRAVGQPRRQALGVSCVERKLRGLG